VAGGECDPLRVIAGARGNDPAGALRIREMRDPVVRSAKLVAENRLQVFPFEEHLVAQPQRQPRRGFERRLDRDVVHAARQDQPQQLVETDARVGLGWLRHQRADNE
jgi:hypothetical protein